MKSLILLDEILNYFEEYFMLSGWILERKNNETIYIRNETGSNRVILKLLTTKMLYSSKSYV